MVNPLGAIIAGAGGGLSAGAGSAIVNIALISYSAANTFINSYYFGYGMILGERDMYQNDWPKIQDRLEKGETFLRILEEKMREKTSAIMALAGDIQLTVDTQYSSLMLQRLLEKPGEAFVAILNYLGIKTGDQGAIDEGQFIDENIPQPGGGSTRPTPTGTGKGIPDILGGDPSTPVPAPKPRPRPSGPPTVSKVQNAKNETWKKAMIAWANILGKVRIYTVADYNKAHPNATIINNTAGRVINSKWRTGLYLALVKQYQAFIKLYPPTGTNYP